MRAALVLSILAGCAAPPSLVAPRPQAPEELGRSIDELSDRLAAECLQRARDRMTRDEIYGALEDLDLVRLLRPQNREAAYERGCLRARLGNHAGAVLDFTAVVDADPGCSAAFHRPGLSRQRLGDAGSAVGDFDRALAREPENIEYLFDRALARESAGDLDGAEADFDRIVALNPQFSEAYFGRGLVRMRRRRDDLANDDFARFRELRPDAIQRLETMREAVRRLRERRPGDDRPIRPIDSTAGSRTLPL